MKTTLKRTILFSFVALIGIGFSSGCRKKIDTIAIIYIRDTANQLVPGAQVVIYGESTTGQQANVTLYDTTTTNSLGEARFNFNETYQLGQAGVAVLDIDAYKDGASGHGIIKVEQETTTEETVFIQ